MGKYRNTTYGMYYKDKIFNYFLFSFLLLIIFINLSQQKVKSYIKPSDAQNAQAVF